MLKVLVQWTFGIALIVVLLSAVGAGLKAMGELLILNHAIPDHKLVTGNGNPEDLEEPVTVHLRYESGWLIDNHIVMLECPHGTWHIDNQQVFASLKEGEKKTAKLHLMLDGSYYPKGYRFLQIH